MPIRMVQEKGVPHPSAALLGRMAPRVATPPNPGVALYLTPDC